MVSIAEKIEEIRKKPEHVRVKYVWGCVAASMVLIVTIWFFSIAAMFKRDIPSAGTDNINSLKEQLQNVNQQMPSIKDIGQQAVSTGNEGINKEASPQEAGDNTDLQYPIQSDTTEIPQSSAYSNEN